MNSLDQIDDEKPESSTQEDEIQKYLNLKLDSKWNFYYLRNDRGLPDNSNWNDRLEYVATFETIGEFWATYQHIKLPSYLPQVSLTFICSSFWSSQFLLQKHFNRQVSFGQNRLYNFNQRRTKVNQLRF